MGSIRESGIRYGIPQILQIWIGKDHDDLLEFIWVWVDFPRSCRKPRVSSKNITGIICGSLHCVTLPQSRGYPIYKWGNKIYMYNIYIWLYMYILSRVLMNPTYKAPWSSNYLNLGGVLLRRFQRFSSIPGVWGILASEMAECSMSWEIPCIHL